MSIEAWEVLLAERSDGSLHVVAYGRDFGGACWTLEDFGPITQEEWDSWHDASYPIDLSEDCTANPCDSDFHKDFPSMPRMHDTAVNVPVPER